MTRGQGVLPEPRARGVHLALASWVWSSLSVTLRFWGTPNDVPQMGQHILKMRAGPDEVSVT